MVNSFSFDNSKIYEVFKHYPQKPITGCNHCMNAESLANLSNWKKEDLSYILIEQYLSNAITTCGDIQDFKRLLPRILQLAPQGTTLYWENLQFALLNANWLEWPEREQNIIKQFLIQYFYSQIGNSFLLDRLIDLGFNKTWPDFNVRETIKSDIKSLFERMIISKEYKEEIVYITYKLDILEDEHFIVGMKKLLKSPENIVNLAYLTLNYIIAKTKFYQSLIDPTLIQMLEDYNNSQNLEKYQSLIANAIDILYIQYIYK